MRLSQWLKQNSVSAEDLAKKLGVTRQTIHNISSGRTEPTLRLADKINAETLGAVGFRDMLKDQSETSRYFKVTSR